ncbi:uncharacterized protein VTP21DRAFT_4582 [Calcarisporiella thermophila]|uniref:uncharacterized protein n=1 Tax=Calcarisporiella thermophila TaxID=911321 RepID=UPI003743A11E
MSVSGGQLSLRLVPHSDGSPAFHFDPIEKQLTSGAIIRIGRFARVLNHNVMFRSKVVSRNHAEIWLEQGNLFIRDVGSSSGTFLNHVRLSPPKTESKPLPIRDGDIIRLGVDYRGGLEEVYRCVKIRIEVKQDHQDQLNSYKIAQFQNLLKQMDPANLINPSSSTSGTLDCCVCLYTIGPLQAIFIAPCSHAFHFRCIRPLLVHHSNFLCPLCRAFADLNTSVEVGDLWESAHNYRKKVEETFPSDRAEDIPNMNSKESSKSIDSRELSDKSHLQDQNETVDFIHDDMPILASPASECFMPSLGEQKVPSLIGDRDFVL